MSNPVEIVRPWRFLEKQVCTIGRRKYQIHDCIRLAQDLPVEDVKLRHVAMDYPCLCGGTLRGFVAHMRMVRCADLAKPILLNEDGVIIDGRHRLARALLEGAHAVKITRFDVDPEDGYEVVE